MTQAPKSMSTIYLGGCCYGCCLLPLWKTQNGWSSRRNHQLDLSVTLIITTIVIVLRLAQQDHRAKHFSYMILAHNYGNHGKWALSFFYMRWESSVKLTQQWNYNNRTNKKADQALWKLGGTLPKYLLSIIQRWVDNSDVEAMAPLLRATGSL